MTFLIIDCILQIILYISELFFFFAIALTDLDIDTISLPVFIDLTKLTESLSPQQVQVGFGEEQQFSGAPKAVDCVSGVERS